MYEELQLPKSPRVARLATEFARLTGGETNAALESLAEKGKIPDRAIGKLPFQPDDKMLGALQHLVDHRGRAIITDGSLNQDRATVLNYLAYADAFPVVIIASHIESYDWLRIFKELWPDKNTITHYRHSNEVPEGTDVVITDWTTLYDQNLLVTFVPETLIALRQGITGGVIGERDMHNITLQVPRVIMSISIPKQQMMELKGETPWEIVSNNDSGDLREIRTYLKTINPYMRLNETLGSQTLHRVKSITSEKTIDCAYARWLTLAGASFDLMLADNNMDRRLNPRLIIDQRRYTSLDNETLEEIASGKREPARGEKFIWKQHQAIRKFERTYGPLKEVLGHFVNKEPESYNYSIAQLISDLENLSRGNWLDDKRAMVRDLIGTPPSPTPPDHNRCVVVANARFIHKAACDTFRALSLYSTGRDDNDKVEETLPMWKVTKNVTPSWQGSRVLVVDFRLAQNQKLLESADRLAFLEYPLDREIYDSIVNTAIDNNVAVDLPVLLGTWEESLLALLLNTDFR